MEMVSRCLLLMLLALLPSSRATEKGKLKIELLENLNKYSEKSSEVLEPLGSPLVTEAPVRREPLGTPLVLPPPAPATNPLLNLFQPPPPPSSLFPGLPNLFNGILPLPFTTQRPFSRQPFRPPPPTPPPRLPTLPTLLPFFAQNGVPQEPPHLNETPLRPLPQDSVATVRPVFINHTIPPSPPPTLKTMTQAVSDNIRDWRQRFYKAFKKLSNRGPQPFTTFAPTPVPGPQIRIHSLPPPLPLPRPSHSMQPIFNDTRVPVIDNPRKVLLHHTNPAWISDQKVKAYARDSKGRIVRLFGVESSGYRYNNSNTNGFIPIPPPPGGGLPSENVGIGPVYIPAARPSTQIPPYNSYPPETPPLNNYVAPSLPPPSPAAIFTVQMPAPPSVAPLSTYPPVTNGPLPPPSDEAMTQEVDGLEYDEVSNDTPCVGCDSTPNLTPADPWLLGADNAVIENNEKCNSLRLRYIIQESIVSSDAEASKRAIQLRAESELGSFYNVVCGTGFFSYIAHTDEFCQASAMDINCYVFSPVCSLRREMGAGIAKKRKVRRRKSYVNKN